MTNGQLSIVDTESEIFMDITKQKCSLYNGKRGVKFVHPITKEFMKGNLRGLVERRPAKVASMSPVKTSDPVYQIEGIHLKYGDRVLLCAQNDSSENGVWTVDIHNKLVDQECGNGSHVKVNMGLRGGCSFVIVDNVVYDY